MPSDFLHAKEEFLTPVWTTHTNGNRTTEIREKGFGWKKRKYLITHNPRQHSLTVTRLYKRDKKGADVSLNYQANPREEQHLTCQWIVRRILTRGNLLTDEEKGNILAASGAEAICLTLLDWTSDANLGGRQPKLGISSKAQPDGNAHTKARTKAVVQSMMKHNHQFTSNILISKSPEYQASILKHLINHKPETNDELNILINSLLNQPPKEVRDLLSVFITAFEQDEQKLVELQQAVHAFVKCNPVRFAEKVKSNHHEWMKLILLAATETPVSNELTQFYTGLFLPHLDNELAIALKTIIDLSSDKDYFDNEVHQEESQTDWLYIPSHAIAKTEDAQQTHLAKFQVEQSPSCLRAMLKNICCLPSEEEQLITIQDYVIRQDEQEQQAILKAIIDYKDKLPELHSELLKSLLKSGSACHKKALDIFFNENTDNIWKLHKHNPKLAVKLIQEQPEAIQAKCIRLTLQTEAVNSYDYCSAKSFIQGNDASAEFKLQLCNHESACELLTVLAHKDLDLGIELIKSQPLSQQATIIASLFFSSEVLSDEVLSLVQALLSKNKKLQEQLSKQKAFNGMVQKLLDKDKDLAIEVLSHQDALIQLNWLTSINPLESCCTDPNLSCISTLLSKTNPNLEELQTKLCAHENAIQFIQALIDHPQLITELVQGQPAKTQISIIQELIQSNNPITGSLKTFIVNIISQPPPVKATIEYEFFKLEQHKILLQQLSDECLDEVLSLICSRTAKECAKLVEMLVNSAKFNSETITQLAPILVGEVAEEFFASEQIQHLIVSLSALNIKATSTLLQTRESSVQVKLLSQITVTHSTSKSCVELLHQTIINNNDVCHQIALKLIESSQAANFIKLSHQKPETAIQLATSLSSNLQTKLAADLICTLPITAAKLFFIKSLLMQAPPKRNELKSQLCQRDDINQLLEHLIKADTQAAAIMCSLQPANWVAAQINTNLLVKCQAEKVADFISISCDKQQKLSIFEEISKLEHCDECFVNLFKANEALLSDSLSDIKPEHQLQILKSLANSVLQGSSEAMGIYRCVCRLQNCNRRTIVTAMSLNKDCLNTQELQVLEIMMLNADLNMLSELNSYPLLIEKAIVGIDKSKQLPALLNIMDTFNSLHSSMVLEAACKNQAKYAETLLSQLSNKISLKKLINCLHNDKRLIKLIAYMDINLRNQLANYTPTVSKEVFLALLQPKTPQSDNSIKDELLTGFKISISIPICKQLFSAQLTQKVKQHFENLALTESCEALSQLLIKALPDTQVEALMIHFHQKIGIAKTTALYLEIAKVNQMLAAKLLFVMSNNTQEQAEYLKALPHPTGIQIINQAPQKYLENNDGDGSAKDWVITECICTNGIESVFGCNIPLCGSHQQNELMNHINLLPASCCCSVLASNTFTVDDKLFIVKRGKWSQEVKVKAILSLFTQPKHQSIPTESLVTFCNGVDESLIHPILCAANKPELNQLVKFFPPKKLENLILNDAFGNLHFTIKLEPELLIAELVNSANEVANLLNRIATSDPNVANQMERNAFANRCIQSILMTQPDDYLAVVVNKSGIPLSKFISSALLTSNKLEILFKDKTPNNITEVFSKIEPVAFKALVPLLPADLQTQAALYCLDKKGSWLRCFPIQQLDLGINLNLKECELLNEHYSPQDDNINKEALQKLYRSAWNKLCDEDIAKFLVGLRPQQIIIFLEQRPAHDDDKKELIGLGTCDTHQIEALLTTLEYNSLVTFAEMIPERQMRTILNRIVVEKGKLEKIARIFQQRPRLTQYIEAKHLAEVINNRVFLSYCKGRMLDSWFAQPFDPEQLINYLFDILPNCTCSLDEFEFDEPIINRVNQYVDGTPAMKAEIYCRFPLPHKMKFFTDELDEKLSQSYIIKDLENGESAILWRLLETNPERWGTVFSNLPPSLLVTQAAKLATYDVEKLISCLRCFPDEVKLMLCRKIDEEEGLGKGEQVLKRLQVNVQAVETEAPLPNDTPVIATATAKNLLPSAQTHVDADQLGVNIQIALIDGNENAIKQCIANFLAFSPQEQVSFFANINSQENFLLLYPYIVRVIGFQAELFRAVAEKSYYSATEMLHFGYDEQTVFQCFELYPEFLAKCQNKHPELVSKFNAKADRSEHGEIHQQENSTQVSQQTSDNLSPETAMEVIDNSDFDEKISIVIPLVLSEMIDILKYLFSEKLSNEEIVIVLKTHFSKTDDLNAETKEQYSDACRHIIAGLCRTEYQQKLYDLLRSFAACCKTQHEIDLYLQLQESALAALPLDNNLRIHINKLPKPELNTASTLAPDEMSEEEAIAAAIAASLASNTNEHSSRSDEISDDELEEAASQSSEGLIPLVKRLITKKDIRVGIWYPRLSTICKAELLKKLTLQEAADNCELLKSTADLADAFKLITDQIFEDENNINLILASNLNNKIKVIADKKLIAEVWCYNPNLTDLALVEDIFTQEEIEDINYTYNPEAAMAQKLLSVPQETEHRCQFIPEELLINGSGKIQIPEGFVRIKIPGIGDCFHRALLYLETKNTALLDSSEVTSKQIRVMMAKRPDGDPSEQAVSFACMNMWYATDKFMALQQPLLEHAKTKGCQSVEDLIYKCTFVSEKFNYYYKDGIKECFEGIKLDSSLQLLFEEFCNEMTFSISIQLQTLTNTNVNLMKKKHTPIIINTGNHYDVLVPETTQHEYSKKPIVQLDDSQ